MSTSVTISEGQKSLEALVPILEQHRPFENKRYPVRSNWASKLGHPCERNLYYMRHDWEKAEPKDWKGMGIRGNLIADWWARYMGEKGFKIIHEQLPLSDEMIKKYQIGGRIDGRIGWGDTKPMLYEFKTMSGRYYDSINSYEDFTESPADWIKGYPAQLQLYLLSQNEEAGLFVLCKIETLEWKIIPVYLDYAYTEWLLQRADRINKANESGTPPTRIPYGTTCRDCEFKMTCLPDIINEGLDFLDNKHLEAILRERDALEENADRWLELDKEAKEIAKAVGKDFIVGTSYKCEIKKVKGTRIDTKKIPIEIASQYEVPTEQMRISFVPLEK